MSRRNTSISNLLITSEIQYTPIDYNEEADRIIKMSVANNGSGHLFKTTQKILDIFLNNLL